MLFSGVREGTFFCQYYPFAPGVILSPDASMTLFFEIGNLKKWGIPVGLFIPGHTLPVTVRRIGTLPGGDIISPVAIYPQIGLRFIHGNTGEQGNEHSMSTAGKIPSICTRNLINPPDNSTGLFLFNGVPRGGHFLDRVSYGGQGILSPDASMTLVFGSETQKKWGIPAACFLKKGYRT